MIKHYSGFSIVAFAVAVAGCNASNLIQTAPIVDNLFDSPPSTTVIAATPGQIAESQGSTSTSNQELTELFGFGYFLHGFTGEDRLWLYETNFGSGDLIESSGDLLLRTPARLSWSEDGGETITVEGNAAFVCNFLESVDLYLCISQLPGGTDNFLLERLSNGVSYGNYEYCEDSESTEACVEGLLNESDGGVRLTVSSAAAATAQASLATTQSSGSLSDALSHKSYQKQGTVGYNLNRGIESERTTVHALIENARARILSVAK